MNTFILMAEVFTEPELRSTSDNQNEVASFLVQFPGRNADEAPSRLKVNGWNNLAKEIMASRYQKGDRLVIEGRLRIDTIDKGGHKEKRTEMTAQRIHGLGASVGMGEESSKFIPSTKPNISSSSANVANSTVPIATPSFSPQEDDIPF